MDYMFYAFSIDEFIYWKYINNSIHLAINKQKIYIKEQNETIKKQQDFVNGCEEKNEALQNDLDLYRTENQQLTELIAGSHEEIRGIREEFEDLKNGIIDVGIASKELENENTELKDRLKILGLSYIGAKCKALNNFNRIDQRYTHQRNWAHRFKRVLKECHVNGAMLNYWWDQIITRYEKWKAKIHNAQQIILNLNQ